jgi:chromosome segregation ATPase
VHIDTTDLEAELAQAQENQKLLTTQLAELTQKKQQYETEINNQFADQLAELEAKIKANIAANSNLRSQLAKLNSQETLAATRLEKLKADRASIHNTKKYYENLIVKLEAEKVEYANAITLVEGNINELTEHIKAQQKLKSLAEGGFRGFLLQFAIDHFNRKAQEYSEIVFGHKDI